MGKAMTGAVLSSDRSSCMLRLIIGFLFQQETVAKLGGLDHLVLNHIILLKLWHWEGTKDNLTLLDKVLKVNFQSYVHLASHSLPHLEKSRGSIIVVSSLAGKVLCLFGY